jgi:hypothetical protein
VCTYSGAALNGAYQPGIDPVDVFKLQSGAWTLQGAAGYPLNDRVVVEPDESPIGVRLVFTFQASAPMSFFNFTTSQYATMCLAPSASGAAL